MTEKEIERQCINLYQTLGCYVLTFSQPFKAAQTRGIADLRVYHAKGNWWHEVKTPRGKQSEYQSAFQRQVERHGEVYILGGLNAAIRQINALGIAKMQEVPE